MFSHIPNELCYVNGITNHETCRYVIGIYARIGTNFETSKYMITARHSATLQELYEKDALFDYVEFGS